METLQTALGGETSPCARNVGEGFDEESLSEMLGSRQLRQRCDGEAWW
jgi:hypothetical protein